MITELAISNLGTIVSATLPLSPGFTAVTGETGAGKTMVVTALGLLMGQRSDVSLVRTGAESARVAGAITTSHPGVQEIVADAGGELEDGELLLTRTVSAGSGGRASVGGVRAPVGVLTQLSERLFAVHGQADQMRLKSAATQRETLDRFGGSELADVLAEYQQAYREHSGLQTELVEITENRAARLREADRLRAEVEEILAVDPQPDETAQIRATLERVSNLESLRASVGEAVAALSAEGDVYGADAQALVGRAEKCVRDAAGAEPDLALVADRLADAAEILRDAAVTLVRYDAELQGEGEASVDSLQQRLADITALEQRYGPDTAAVLEYAENAQQRLLELDGDDLRVDKLQGLVAAAAARLSGLQQRLSQLRTAAAERLSELVTAEFAALALPESRLVVAVEPQEPGVWGADRVVFNLVPHQGATPRPLAKAASGGELSRIMLALEVVLAESDPVATFVFDEIDAGIGGSAAIEVGKRLARLARHAQVVVVTHLAQVAAFADNHLCVKKDVNGEFTSSSGELLHGGARVGEIARLLSGLSDSESARQHAQELLDLARDSAER